MVVAAAGPQAAPGVVLLLLQLQLLLLFLLLWCQFSKVRVRMANSFSAVHPKPPLGERSPPRHSSPLEPHLLFFEKNKNGASGATKTTTTPTSTPVERLYPCCPF
jgi:hypothetical protein